MALKVLKKMPNFQGLTTGSAFTATLSIPIGLSIEQLYIVYGGDIALADMTNLVVEANGKEIMNFRTGTELDRFNQFMGRAAAAGTLTVDFTRFGLRTREAEELTKLGTGAPFDNNQALANGRPNPGYNPFPVSSLTFRADVSANTTVSMIAYAEMSAPAPTGLIRKIRRIDPAAMVAGENTITEVPKGDDINSIFFWKTDINSLFIDRDGYRVFEATDALNDVRQTDGVRVPLASAFVFDPTYMGNGAETLTTRGVADLRFIPTISVAGSCPITVDYIGPLNG